MCQGLPKPGVAFGWVVSCILALLAQAGPARADPALKVDYNSDGLSSLNYGLELLVDGNPKLTSLHINPPDETSKLLSPLSAAFERTGQTTIMSYSWGRITAVYRVEGDRLLADVTLQNSCKSTVTDARIDLLSIKFPSTPAGTQWQHRYDSSCDNADNIPALLADWGSARLALCSEDLDSTVKFGFRALKGEPYAITLRFDGQLIAPGTSRAARISIRLGGESSPGWTIASDVLKKFADKYPQELEWKDRRPIGSAFLATSIAGYKNNPRGWFLDPDLNTNTPEGRAEFKKKLMNYEDQVISHCKLMDAQGVIVWDLEGQEMPHATSYLADPRMLWQVAPEMDAVADQFFKRLTEAGLRTGLTIRPTRVQPATDGKGGWTQVEVADPVAEMDAKISYASKRWGCTIFYLDSNVNFVRDAGGKILSDPAMPGEDFQRLASLHPDCLLIPEHKTDRYWAYTAPYSELRLGFTGTPADVREAYPQAFSVLRVVDGPALDSQAVVDALTAAITSGDILLFRPWWDDPSTAQIKQLYLQAAKQRDVPK